MRFALLLLSVIIAGRAGAQTLSEGKQLIYYERYASARTVLEKAPGSPETTFWLAKAELGLRDTAAARAHFLSVPLAGDLGALARAYAGQDRYAMVGILTRMIAEEKKHPEAGLYLMLGDAYTALMDGGNAVTSFTHAQQIDPRDAAAHYKIGLIYESQRNAEQFLPEYEAALAVDSTFAPAAYRLYVYYYSRDVLRSANYLRQYAAHADPSPLLDLAGVDILFASGHYAEAIARAKSLIPAAPEAFRPHYDKLMAYAYDSMGNYALAAASIDAYFARPDTSLTPRNYTAAAHIYYKGGFSHDSIFTYLRRAVALDTSVSNQVRYVRYAARLADSLKEPMQRAYWLGQVCLLEKEPDASDLYAYGSQLFNTAEVVRAADSATRAGASDPYYRMADSVFAVYIDKFPDYAVYGYYWRARSNWSLDTDLSKGLAVPYFQKMLVAACASRDSAHFTGQIEMGDWFLTNYYYKKKDYEQALAYDTKYLEYEPGDKVFIRLRDQLQRYLKAR